MSRERSLGNTQTIFAAYLPDVTEFKKLPVASWPSRLFGAVFGLEIARIVQVQIKELR